MASQASSGRTLVVAMLGDAFSDQVIGYFSTLGETIASLADLEIVPPITIVVGKIVFADEILGNFIESDAYILKAIKGGAKIEVFLSKHTNLALRLDNTLLMMSLTSSSDPVGVPTSPGYTMILPAIVIRVQLGYDFWGHISHTTLRNEIYFRCSTGIFLRLVTKKVS